MSIRVIPKESKEEQRPTNHLAHHHPRLHLRCFAWDLFQPPFSRFLSSIEKNEKCWSSSSKKQRGFSAIYESSNCHKYTIMADKRVNVLVYSGMSLLASNCACRLLMFEFQAMALRLNLSVTVSGLCAAFSVQTMLSFPSLESLFSRSRGLHLALCSLCPVEQMQATVAL